MVGLARTASRYVGNGTKQWRMHGWLCTLLLSQDRFTRRRISPISIGRGRHQPSSSTVLSPPSHKNDEIPTGMSGRACRLRPVLRRNERGSIPDRHEYDSCDDGGPDTRTEPPGCMIL